MQVSEMVANVNFACQPITNINDVIKRSLNRGQQAIASAAPPNGWEFLKICATPMNVTASEPLVILSHRVDTTRILTVYSTEEGPFFINPISESEFRQYLPNPTDVGNPYLYRWQGTSPVGVQPTSASVITVVSTSTADDTTGATPVSVNIYGKNASGVDVVEVLELDGTTPVVGTVSFASITALSKNAYCTGIITVTSNSGAVTNAIFGPRDRSLSHPVIRLYPAPSIADNYFYDYTTLLPNIWADTDISIIPEQYHDAIEEFAKYEVFTHLNNPAQAQNAMEKFQARIQDIINAQRRPNGVRTMNPFMPEDMPYLAQLPSYFPRSSY